MTWTSVDGRIWRQMPDAGWHHREIDLLRRYNRTVIGIGIDWTREGGSNRSIWSADLPPIEDYGAAPPLVKPPVPSEGCG